MAMAEMISIELLNALFADQYQLMGFVEDHPGDLPVFDPVDDDRNQVEVIIAGEPWSITASRTGWEFCHAAAGRTVLLSHGHGSPFDFEPRTLLRYVLSVDASSLLNALVLDNWILKLSRAGRLAPSRHRAGYYTVA